MEPSEAYRFDATATTCGHSDLGSRILAGTEAATSFLFLRVTRPPCRERLTRGEPRSVRSFLPRCRFLPFARVCPTAMELRTRHLRRLAPPQHSDDRRARASGPSEGRVPWSIDCSMGSKVLAHGWRRADDVPLLGVQRAPPVAGAPARRGRDLDERMTDRPRSTFWRHPAKGAVIRRIRCFPPPRFTGARKDRSFRLPASASRSRRPHVFPGLGKSACRALQAPRERTHAA